MKKYYILSILVCSLLVMSPKNFIAYAHAEDEVNADVKVEIRESNSNRGKAPTAIERLEQLRMEQELKIKERERVHSTSTMKIEDRKDRMEDKRPLGVTPRIASSTREKMEDRREESKKLRLDAFKKKQKNIISQLEKAVSNLKQVRGRLVSRIEKAEASGRNMTEPRRLLAIADTKIDLATKSIEALENHNPIASTTVAATTTNPSSTEVDLSKARQINAEAIKAIRDAHRALIDVVVSIAHNMGIKCSKDGDSVRCEASTDTEANSTTTTP